MIESRKKSPVSKGKGDFLGLITGCSDIAVSIASPIV